MARGPGDAAYTGRMIEVLQERLKRWTVAEVQRMIGSGAFESPESFELIDGLIVDKMGQNAPHRISLRLAIDALRTAYAGTATVDGGLTLPLSDASEPEPDVIVATTPLGQDIPKEDVLLVVEVSDSTLRTDRTTKAALYARHGIPEYLILDVAARRAEIRRRPEGDEWRETRVLGEDESFTPNGARGAIRVADLFAV